MTSPAPYEYFYDGDGWFVLVFTNPKYVTHEALDYMRNWYNLKRVTFPTDGIQLHFQLIEYEDHYQESSTWMDDVFQQIVDETFDIYIKVYPHAPIDWD